MEKNNVIRNLLGYFQASLYLKKHRKGSPMVEESILLGLALFAFMILASIIFDLIDFAKNIFSDVSEGLDRIPG